MGPTPSTGHVRIAEVDFLRSMAIFGVALTHCAGMVPVPGDTTARLIGLFRFGAPVFFVFWACFLARSLARGMDPGAGWARFARYFAILVAWTLVHLVAGGALGEAAHPVDFVKRRWTGAGWPGQYFLCALLATMPFFGSLHRLALRLPPVPTLLLGTIAFAVLDGVTGLPPGLRRVGMAFPGWWLPYLIAGIHLAQGWRPVFPNRPTTLGAAGLLLLLDTFVAPHRLAGTNVYATPCLLLATVLLAGSALSGRRPEARSAFRWERIAHVIAANTMAIYVLNPMGLVVAGRWFPGGMVGRFPADGILVPIVCTALVIGAALAAAAGMRTLRLGFLVDN